MGVYEVMWEMKERRCGLLLQLLLVWVFSIVIFEVYRLQVAGLWRDDADLEMLSDMFVGGPLLRTIPLVVVMMLSPVPSRVHTVELAHATFIVSSILSQWMHTDLIDSLRSVRNETSGRILAACVSGRPASVFVLNALYVGCTSMRGSRSDLFLSVFIALIGSIISHGTLLSEARAIVASMTAESSEAVVQDLLGMMCDAVVLVDVELNVVPPSRALDVLLLRRPPTNSTVHFPSLFQEQERDRIVQFFASGDGQSMHTNLQDEGGVVLGVQLFCKRFEDVLGRLRHVIGIVEEVDCMRPATPHALPHDSQEPGHDICRAGIREFADADSRDDPSSPSFSSSGGSHFIPLDLENEEGTVEVQIDIESPILRILRCTASFTHITGPLEDGQGLLELVPTRKQDQFLQWARHATDTAPTTSVTLHTRAPGSEVRAKCSARTRAYDLAGTRCFVLTRVRHRGRGHRSVWQSTERGTQPRVRRILSL